MKKLFRITPPFIVVALLLAMHLLCGCSTVGKPMRHKPAADRPLGERWFVEGKTTNDQPYSCSFVEFDGRGDYIDFNQHVAAYQKIAELSRQQPIVLVFYCHGWKNNSQSGDVVEFNSFLGRLAASPALKDNSNRVHGVYLSWRGNVLRPFVDQESQFYIQTTKDFGAPIVDPDQTRKISWTGTLTETLSYWSRRRAAEHKVSAIPMARTVYTCASLAKAIDKQKGRDELMESSRVLVMGHSFGALVLERALGPASISALTERWPWFGKFDTNGPVNPLPIDFALFVNSAAPAIYAKETRDFLAAHRNALQAAHVPVAPVFVSLTSSADGATGRVHPIGNVFARFHRSLQRTYTNLLQTADGTKTNAPVHQSRFFNRTPGHQPLLVDHWLERDKTLPQPAAVDHYSILLTNLDYSSDDWFHFYTSPTQGSKKSRKLKVPDKALGWKITTEVPKQDQKWANQFGGLVPRKEESSYWILRCNKQLIRGHNDCWSDTTMQVYAALYRLVECERANEVGDARQQAENARPPSR